MLWPAGTIQFTVRVDQLNSLIVVLHSFADITPLYAQSIQDSVDTGNTALTEKYCVISMQFMKPT